MMTRQEKILSCIDPRTQIGIEIGALDKPIVTREMGDIRYVDHASTADLRQKYANDPHVDTEAIVDVRYVWGDQTLPDLVAQDAPFDYVIASHVIEHVPDLIGWLKEIHAVLKPGGILALAIPDKRYCFDYLRPLTQPADIIEAYLRRQRKPSPRQVFDHFSSIVCRNGLGTWIGEVQLDELQHIYTKETALDLAQKSVSTTDYIDVHCWVLTPTSFFELLRSCIQLKLCDFKVAQFHETTGCEFYVSLEAMDLSKEEGDRQIVQLESLPEASEEIVETCHTKQLQQLATELSDEQARLRDIQNKLKDSRDSKKRLKAKVLNLQERVKTYEDEINSMRSSKFWKLRSHWMNFKKLLNL